MRLNQLLENDDPNDAALDWLADHTTYYAIGSTKVFLNNADNTRYAHVIDKFKAEVRYDHKGIHLQNITNIVLTGLNGPLPYKLIPDPTWDVDIEIVDSKLDNLKDFHNFYQVLLATVDGVNGVSLKSFDQLEGVNITILLIDSRMAMELPKTGWSNLFNIGSMRVGFNTDNDEKKVYDAYMNIVIHHSNESISRKKYMFDSALLDLGLESFY
jgi:hypothetical protein